MKKASRILITRTDRLGDVLMSLHAVVSVRRQLPEAEVDFLVRAEVVPVLAPFMAKCNVKLVEWTGKNSYAGYSAALCLFDEPALLAALKKDGVPVRVGNFSKLRSFFSLSHGVRQRRGLGRQNEAEYNLELAKLFLGALGVADTYRPEPLTLPADAAAAELARKSLAKIGVNPGEPYWIAHPGMGGSALNLKPEGYVQLLDGLAKTHKGPLVLTLGPAVADLRFIEAIHEQRHEWRVLPKGALATLAEVFRGASLVVAPSTGPLHLAHYVGTPTLGIYSPVRAHQPRRWAPWGGSGKSEVLAPQHACPGKKDCLGPRCKHYYCLDQLPKQGLSIARAM